MCRKLKTSTLVKRVLQERIDGCNATAQSPGVVDINTAVKLETYKEVITLIEQLEGRK